MSAIGSGAVLRNISLTNKVPRTFLPHSIHDHYLRQHFFNVTGFGALFICSVGGLTRLGKYQVVQFRGLGRRYE
jgi:hypothetical protein